MDGWAESTALVVLKHPLLNLTDADVTRCDESASNSTTQSTNATLPWAAPGQQLDKVMDEELYNLDHVIENRQRTYASI